MESVSAECLLYLDSDDLWLPGHAETIVSILESSADVAVAGSVTLIDDGGKPLPYRTVHQPRTLPIGRSSQRVLRLSETLQMRAGLTATSCIGVRRDALDGGIQFSPTLETLEDFDFVIQCLDAGLTVVQASPLTVFRDGRGDEHLFRNNRALPALDQIASRWETQIFSTPRTGRRFILNRARYSCLCDQPITEGPILTFGSSVREVPLYLKVLNSLQKVFGSRMVGRLARILQLAPLW